MTDRHAQFTLLALFMAMTALCFLLGAAVYLGAGTVLALLGATLVLGYVTVVWSAFNTVAPEAAKYLTVLGLIAFMLLGPLPMVLQHRREEARRLQASNNVRRWITTTNDHLQRGMPIVGGRMRPRLSTLFEEPTPEPFVVEIARAPTPLDVQIARARWFRDEDDYSFVSPIFFEP
jgi:hypothetical protein